MGIDPTADVHATAVIEPGAEIGPSCRIGPYCVVGGEVVLGARLEPLREPGVAASAHLHEQRVEAGVARVGHEACDLFGRGERRPRHPERPDFLLLHRFLFHRCCGTFRRCGPLSRG